MWAESRYNVLVKQVEGCSDILRTVVATVKVDAEWDPTAREIVRRMEKIIEYLDVQSLKMLSRYDPGARQMLAQGVKYDPRRDMFKSKPAAKSIEGAKEAKQ